MASTIIANVGTISDISGAAWQSHIVHDGTYWWVFYFDSSATTSLKSAYSSDLTTWNAGATLTVAATITQALNLCATIKTISGHTVVHVAYTSNTGSYVLYRVRGTISGATLTWGSPSAIGFPISQSLPLHENIVLSSDNKLFCMTPSSGSGNAGCHRTTDADDGTTGPTTNVDEQVSSTTWYCNSGTAIPLASGNMLDVWEKADTTETASMTNVSWSKFTGSWSAKADIFTNFGASDPNNYGIVKVSDTDIHAVARSGSNTYEHKRFDGSSWSSGHSISTQNSLANGGIFMASDGTNVWLFVIDTDGANTIRYCEWTGSSWGSWTALETTTKTRTFISGYPVAVGGVVAALWTEDHGDGTYDLVVEGLGGGGGGSKLLLLDQDMSGGFS